MGSSRLGPIFSDRVITPTELARHVREVTQRALREPITIHRPEGDLALLDRDRVAALAATAAAAEDLVDSWQNLLWLLRGRGEPTPAWEWLRQLSADSVVEFLDEYLAAMKQALAGEVGWGYVAAVLHEWRESALALTNHGLLAELVAFRGVASEEETARLSAAELRERLESAVATSSELAG